MGSQTDIEWADRTWNPVTGCSKISSGCKYCYAETQAERFAGGKAFPDGFGITLRHHKITEPLRYRKHARIFVNSMSDVFHEGIPEDFRSEVFGTMLACLAFTNSHNHEFLILTKRSTEMKEYFSPLYADLIERWTEAAALNLQCKDPDLTFAEYIGYSPPPHPLPNLWMGVSVELTKHLKRIEDLQEIPAAVKFVSLEPLLNAIDFDQLAEHLRGIDWVIIGGESGPKARPCMPEWIRHCVQAARAAGCAVFVKQMGSWWANSHKSKDYKGGLMSEWPEDLRIREFPEVYRG